jgi:hypothetical protein
MVEWPTMQAGDLGPNLGRVDTSTVSDHVVHGFPKRNRIDRKLSSVIVEVSINDRLVKILETVGILDLAE